MLLYTQTEITEISHHLHVQSQKILWVQPQGGKQDGRQSGAQGCSPRCAAVCEDLWDVEGWKGTLWGSLGCGGVEGDVASLCAVTQAVLALQR